MSRTMRELINLIESTETKASDDPLPSTKVKTKTSDNPFSSTAFQPKAKQLPAHVKQQQMRAVQNAVASADTTNMPSINYDNLPTTDTDLDTAGSDQRPQEPGTMPAEINKGVMGAGEQAPDWFQIDQLPGYMQRGIRAMGKVVFGTFTSTPLADINILANLNGAGPHEDIELNAVAGNAISHAVSSIDLSMQFGDVIPGYEPDAKLYITNDYTYMVVQDQMGKYIYSWDSKDNKEQYALSNDSPDRLGSS